MKAMKLMPFALMVGANLESVVMVLIKMERLGLIGANLAGPICSTQSCSSRNCAMLT